MGTLDPMTEPPPPTRRPVLYTTLLVLFALCAVGILVVTLVVAFDEDDDSIPLPPVPANAPPNRGVPPPAAGDAEYWAGQLADRVDIPTRALQAYGYAASVVAAQRPDCQLSWTVLAGIGDVESDHGRFEGAEVDGDGVARPGIRGLPLDGRPGLREIRDTDGGALDGDTEFDRAVGPMQFIPTSWDRHGMDADDDGRENPDDIDDAALAAADLLCDATPSLGDAEGWWRGVLAYNRSAAYGQDVLDRGDMYGRRSNTE